MNYVMPVIVGFLLFVTIIQYQHAHELDADIHMYQQQIGMLKIDSERQAEDTKLAYESAQTQMRQLQDKTQGILRTKVSSNCEESIKWLIQQAHTL
jgi:hypothetical protein